MVNSNARKRTLAGWLQENSPETYAKSLKFQKYLLLYELFSKINGEEADLNYLKGYKRGPVFSNVYGDYTHERAEFDDAVRTAYRRDWKTIDNARAKKCSFICQTQTEKELSALTHHLHLWYAKEDEILSGVPNVALSETDFNQADEQLLSALSEMYPIEMVDSSAVVGIGSKYFVFSKEDMDKLTESQMDILCELAESEDLVNPVFVEIDAGGRLIVD